MFVTALHLTDFRSYAEVEVGLGPGVSVFTGANGQGKTNLVEAVEYLSTGASHRVSSDAPLVRMGCAQAVARARVQAGRDDERTIVIEMEITPGKANRARLNRAPVRPREVIGALRTVVFSPADLAIVRGDPADRRGFLDSLVVTRWPRMAGVKADYERVLRQRNALLKSIAGKSLRSAGADAVTTLEVWDDQLARFGAELLHARLDTLAEVLPHAQAAYATIAPVNNEISASYRASCDLGEAHAQPDVRAALTAQLLGAIAERRKDELARGVSLVGPHRDEVVLGIGALPAKGYASHGESWSLALALRLGGFQLLRADGIEAVLVLDDVFAELDTTRRERLAEAISSAEQVLVTAAVGADVPDFLAGQRFVVAGGTVTEADQREGGHHG
ncbi:MAG: DNA replication/repair protein RecF [Propionibacteriaceae bacterium]|nr:DNA replication/repair protein RecF [Propionibacteriaceae bacterium]